MSKNTKITTFASLIILATLTLSYVGYMWYTNWSRPDVTVLEAGDVIPGRFSETITEDDLYKIGYDTGEETIVVDVNEDTPQIVIDQTQEKLDAIDVNTTEGILEAQELMDSQGELTQKTFILVYKAYYACSPQSEEFDESEVEYQEGWTYYGSVTGGSVTACTDEGRPWDNKEELVKAIEESAANSLQPKIAVILSVDNEVDMEDQIIPQEDVLPEPTANPTSAPEGGEFFGDI